MATKLLDMLLSLDEAKLKLPTRQVEITRLTELCGEPFMATCVALTPAKYEELQDAAIDIDGKDVDVNMGEMQVLAVIEGVCLDDGTCLCKNKELMLRFKCPTPKELARKLFLSGEVSRLYSTISDLSGFGDDAVKEVKN